VAIAAGGGMIHEQIAIAIGISEPTLRKHFGHELTEGAYRKRIEVIEALRKVAAKGNVSAAKAYLALEPQLAAPPFDRPGESTVDKPAAAPPAPPQPRELGKKAQAQADAATAHVGTEWEHLLSQQPPGQVQ
jgi:hypothetical protein